MFTGVLNTEIHPPASPVLKPVPVILTAVPLGPEVGVRISDGIVVVTTKVAEAVSRLDPVTVTRYVPGVAPLATVKLLPVK
jgi:hypothetical protein